MCTQLVKRLFGSFLIRGILLIVRAEPLFPTNSMDRFLDVIFSAVRFSTVQVGHRKVIRWTQRVTDTSLGRKPTKCPILSYLASDAGALRLRLGSTPDALYQERDGIVSEAT
jgi:hypothetical protein